MKAFDAEAARREMNAYKVRAEKEAESAFKELPNTLLKRIREKADRGRHSATFDFLDLADDGWPLLRAMKDKTRRDDIKKFLEALGFAADISSGEVHVCWQEGCRDMHYNEGSVHGWVNDD